MLAHLLFVVNVGIVGGAGGFGFWVGVVRKGADGTTLGVVVIFELGLVLLVIGSGSSFGMVDLGITCRWTTGGWVILVDRAARGVVVLG